MIHTYIVLMDNGVQYQIGCRNKKNAESAFAFCAEHVVNVQRVYKTGKRAVAPW